MQISAQNHAHASLPDMKTLRNAATLPDLKALFFRECSTRGNVPSLLQIDTVNSEVFNKTLRDGDCFAIDAVSHGFHYNGDFGRTVFVGEPTKSMKNATDAISLGWDAVREKLRPGLRYSEIRKIVDKGYQRARKVLTERIEDLHKLAKAHLTYETLSGEEIENLINKNVYPTDKEDLKVEEDKGSALSSLGLKPKIVH